MISPIQTTYSDCLFRSRLEARWAVFFDYVGIEWQYEPEGFEIKRSQDWHFMEDETWNYLPDFFLPNLSTWVEVKPNFNDLSDDFLYMLQCAVDWGGQLPHVGESYGTSAGILLLTSIPRTNDYEICHPILQHHKGGHVNIAIFEFGNIKTFPNHNGYFDSGWGDKTCIKESLINIDGYQGLNLQDGRVQSAYIRARKSRFEHGVTP